ncbi:TRAG family protein [Ammonifex degensii KC4]|uniref:TRAG family protein n=1 Tax=Ammonifex degensii (strain DSM 10501 / KC4) TaxID=429009 RepID=C9R835_AMMDK|nr:type IV secretory system conjugative DNA transfer family protein [Ammonifex degensii]ACX52464.1 TRAG family protein [Ammonifex degensii KC4]
MRFLPVLFNRPGRVLVPSLVLLVFTLVAGFCWSYPLLLLWAGAVAWTAWQRRKDAVLACLLPWLLAALFYNAGALIFSLAALAKGGAMPAAKFWDWGWLGLAPLSPPDSWARAGLVVGMPASLLLGRLRRTTRHDERHVHGLRVADSPAKGTGRWGSDRDVADVCEFGPPGPGHGGVVLGKLKGRIVRAVPEKAPTVKRPAHALAVAGSGGGKTFCFVVPNVIAGACDGESLIVTDPKGELTPLLAPWLRKRMGYKVFVFNLADPRHSSFWNPLLECRTPVETYQAAQVLVLNAQERGKGSPFFTALEIQALTALMSLLRADFPEDQAHLRSVLSLLSWPKNRLKERFDSAYRAGKLDVEGHEAFRGAYSHWENAVAGLTSKLALFRDPDLARLLSRQELDLEAFGKEKAALFCVLPVGSDYLRPILAVFYHFLLDRLYTLARSSPGQRLPVPVRLILDEFANIGRIPKFQEIMATARGLGIKVLYVLQELQQLKDNYPGEDMSILGNTFVKVYLGGSEKPTREYFSRELGEAAVYVETERQDVTHPWNRLEAPKRTRTVVRRALMEADELGRLPEKNCVALLQGHYPLYLEKCGWTELPQAREIRELAGRTVADVVEARPDVQLQLPPYPEGEDEDGKPGNQEPRVRSGADDGDFIRCLFLP